MTKQNFYKALRATRNLMKWKINTKGQIRGTDIDNRKYCPLTAVEKALYGNVVNISKVHEALVYAEIKRDSENLHVHQNIICASDDVTNIWVDDKVVAHERELLLKALDLNP
jgi:hypothetical protein